MIMQRVAISSAGVFVACLACAPHADAHRLDEYLQATRVSIDVDRVSVEIDLTAGTSVAASVFGWIDTDADGQLSGAERAAYARQVIDSVMLTADGHRVTLAVNGCDFPDRREMTEGIGTVRLRASARLPDRHHEPAARSRAAHADARVRCRLWRLAAGAAPGVGDRHPLAPPQHTNGSIVSALFDPVAVRGVPGK